VADPEVPIAVDAETGVWSVDGLPMILVPRHFLVNNHKAIEAAIGVEANARLLHEAGRESAYYWCEREAATHGIAGADVFRHYMRRLSQRGWARFTVLDLDAAAGTARIRVDHSVFVAEYGREAGRKVCYMFLGWFVGALDYAGRGLGRDHGLRAAEVACAAEGRSDHCLFEVVPR